MILNYINVSLKSEGEPWWPGVNVCVIQNEKGNCTFRGLTFTTKQKVYGFLKMGKERKWKWVHLCRYGEKPVTKRKI